MAERLPIFEISRSNPSETWQQVEYPMDLDVLFVLIAIRRNIEKLVADKGIAALQVISGNEGLRAVVIAEDIDDSFGYKEVGKILDEGSSLPNGQLPITYEFLRRQTVEEIVGRVSPNTPKTVAVLKFVV